MVKPTDNELKAGIHTAIFLMVLALILFSIVMINYVYSAPKNEFCIAKGYEGFEQVREIKGTSYIICYKYDSVISNTYIRDIRTTTVFYYTKVTQ